MKIVCISDTHGYLPKNLPNGDVLVMAGDVCPVDNHRVPHQKWWLEQRFNLWLDSLKFKDVVLVAGNHDWIFETNQIPDLKCNVLNESIVIIDHVKFYGYPHQPVFCNWAFNRGPHDLIRIADKIPDDTDVLITHGPAYGILDRVMDKNCWAYGKGGTNGKDDIYLGDKALKARLNNLPNLKLHVCGHIHSARAVQKPLPGDKIQTIFVNASYVDERYQPYDSIFSVEI